MKRIIMSLTLLTLSGCAAGLDGDYGCKKIGGTSSCTTMDDIRNNPYGHAGQDRGDAILPPTAPASFTLLPRRDRHGQPTRSRERVKKVTIFPFKDQDNDYVDTMDVYFVLDDSQWSGRPAPAIWQD
ncbi:MAG: type IV conjugative transfer system lipoprotein TraV [Ketobacter sp.]|nr:type IV conjugative transfer system lipoprotein TraV [Ketobacter sp.]